MIPIQRSPDCEPQMLRHSQLCIHQVTLFPLLFFLPFFFILMICFLDFRTFFLGPFFTDLSYEEHNEVKLLACLSKLLYLTWWTMLVRLPPTFYGRPIFSAKKCSLVEVFAGLMSLGFD